MNDIPVFLKMHVLFLWRKKKRFLAFFRFQGAKKRIFMNRFPENFQKSEFHIFCAFVAENEGKNSIFLMEGSPPPPITLSRERDFLINYDLIMKDDEH